jgi:Xaa-Pro dipeptidase
LYDDISSVDAHEAKQVTELRIAQNKAERLFREVESRGLIRAGVTENQVNEDIYALAKEMYGITTYWHKRIVRAGRNTLAPYDENPPNLTIGEDDILFLDLGPVFEEWEADFGRTFVIGSDPAKLKLKNDVELAFAAGKQYFNDNPAITSSQLYGYAWSLAAQFGWEFGGPIAGHLIGQFPHEKIAGDKVTLYVHPDSHLTMRSLDEKGQKRHWILEIHFVDRKRQIGGFFEELLTVG